MPIELENLGVKTGEQLTWLTHLFYKLTFSEETNDFELHANQDIQNKNDELTNFSLDTLTTKNLPTVINYLNEKRLHEEFSENLPTVINYLNENSLNENSSTCPEDDEACSNYPEDLEDQLDAIFDLFKTNAVNTFEANLHSYQYNASKRFRWQNTDRKNAVLSSYEAIEQFREGGENSYELFVEKIISLTLSSPGRFSKPSTFIQLRQTFLSKHFELLRKYNALSKEIKRIKKKARNEILEKKSERKHHTLQEIISTQETQIQSLTIKNGYELSQRKKLLKDNKSLAEQLDIEKKKNTDLEFSFNEQRQLTINLEDEKNKLLNEKKQLHNENAKLTHRCENHDLNLSEIEYKFRTRLEENLRTNLTLKNEIDSLKQKLVDNQKQEEEKSNPVLAWGKKIASNFINRDTAPCEADASAQIQGEQSSEAEKVIDAFNTRVSELSTQLSAAQNIIEEEKSKNNELKEKLGHAENENAKLRRDNSKLAKCVKALKEKLKPLFQALKRFLGLFKKDELMQYVSDEEDKRNCENDSSTLEILSLTIPASFLTDKKLAPHLNEHSRNSSPRSFTMARTSAYNPRFHHNGRSASETRICTIEDQDALGQQHNTGPS